MEYQKEYYFPYKDLCLTGRDLIFTRELTDENIDSHFTSIINILKDGIETPEVQSMMIHIVFQDQVEIDLSIFDYLFNLMM